MKLNSKIRYLLTPESGMQWEYDSRVGLLSTDTISYEDSISLIEFNKKWFYKDRFLGLIKLSFLTQIRIRDALRGSNITNVEFN